MKIENQEKRSLRRLCLADQPSFDRAVQAFAGSGFDFAFAYQLGDHFDKYLAL